MCQVDYSTPTLVNNASLPSGETSLDIQFGLGLIGSPSVLGQIYHVGASDTPFIDIMNAALSDPHPPTVLSFSYDGQESDYAGMSDYIAHANSQFQLMGARGISVMVSSGDTGAYAPQSSLSAACAAFSPTWPATSPYVTSVGASTLKSAVPGQCPSQVQCSVEYGALITGGGGFSTINPMPDYQRGAVQGWLNSSSCQALRPTSNAYNTSQRAFPDLVLFGHNYGTVISGLIEAVDGTSASTPSFAGIMALYNDLRARKGLPHLGFLNPLLYHAAAANPASFRDVTEGSNKCMEVTQGCCSEGFTACAGFDPVTGLGAPDFSVLQTFFAVEPPLPAVTNMIAECAVAPNSGGGDDGDDNSSRRRTVIIVAASVAALAIVAFVVWCIQRKRVAEGDMGYTRQVYDGTGETRMGQKSKRKY